MQITFSNTREEYLEAYIVHYFGGAWGWVLRVAAGSIGTIFLLASLKLFSRHAEVNSGHPNQLAESFCCLLLGVIMVLPITGKMGFRLLPIGTGKVLRETTVIAGPDSIEFSRGTDKRTFAWGELVRVRETPNVFILCFSRGAYQVITKRALDERQRAFFRERVIGTDGPQQMSASS